jgi:peptide/nickel transport system ATP-binding protein
MSNLLDIEKLSVRFCGEKTVHAVNGVSLSMAQGEVLGILGESGSGKSVMLKSLLRLLPKKKTQIEGRIAIEGVDVLSLEDRPLADYRGRVVSMVFQDPTLALDPVYTIGQQIAEAIVRHSAGVHGDPRKRAISLLERVRIQSPERRIDSYPHELSGGMRQRAMIALALAASPKLLLADEPTTALDATVQIQILLLLRQLQQEFGMGVIFVTHDIGVAIEMCDKLAVMYAGQIVETGTVREVIESPRHPYTKALLAANLYGVKRGVRLDAIPGAPPALHNPPSSCSFAPRCKEAQQECRLKVPEDLKLGPARTVRCIRGVAQPEPAASPI